MQNVLSCIYQVFPIYIEIDRKERHFFHTKCVNAMICLFLFILTPILSMCVEYIFATYIKKYVNFVSKYSNENVHKIWYNFLSLFIINGHVRVRDFCFDGFVYVELNCFQALVRFIIQYIHSIYNA